MKALWPYDSAVVIYWERPERLPPGGKREVGFAYGLGNVSSSKELLVTADGSFKPGGQFTVTALISNPKPKETLELKLPAGFRLVNSNAIQLVPAATEDASSRNSRPVTWKVQAGTIGKHELTVRSSSNVEQKLSVTIQASSIFD